MPRAAVIATILGAALPWAALAADGGSLARPERRLKEELARIARAPASPDAEASLIAVSRLAELLGPEPVAEAIERAAELPGISVRLRARAAHLLLELRADRGDVEGAEAEAAKAGFIDGWAVIGPFDNEGGTGFDTPFLGEDTPFFALAADAGLPGKSGEVRWRVAPRAALERGFLRMDALFGESAALCAYAAATFTAAEPGRALLQVGAGGAVKAYWNGRPALADSAIRAPDPDRFGCEVQVAAGRNRLLVKICSEDRGSFGLFARITDRDAAPWPLRAEGDQLAALAAQVASSSFAARVTGQWEKLVAAAERKGASAAVRSSAARYLALTGSEPRSSHLGRDLARLACEQQPTADRCLLSAALSIDRNERRLAVERARAAEPAALEPLLALARLELEGRFLFRARAALNEALARAPRDLETLILDAELRAAEGFPRAALSSLTPIVDAHPGALRAVALAEDLAAATGNAALWLRFARLASEADFTDVERHETLARAALARGDLDGLRLQATLVRRIAPFDADASISMAELLAGAGLHAEARALLEAALEVCPDSFGARRALGLFLMRRGAREEGLAALQRAMGLRPQDAWLADYLDYHQPRDPFAEPYLVAPDRFLDGIGKTGDPSDARYLVDQKIVRVFESGLSAERVQRVIEIRTREGARRMRQHGIEYAPARQRVTIQAARVFHPDGTVESASSSGSVPLGEPWYRLYYDVEAVVIDLPALAPGDVIELDYRVDDTAERNELADYFGDFAYIEDDLPKDLWRYVIIAPATRALHFNEPSAPGLTRSTARRGALDVSVFEARSIPGVEREPGMPGPSETMAHLHVSTFASWQDLGRWYGGLIRHQIVPDQRIRDKTRELVAGKTALRDRVNAIYGWVVSATRYVGLEFGIHGYQPYRAPLVVARGFGDCKDKAALLVTMLQEAGIEAEFVLLRTNDLGVLGELPASLAVFNHAIARVPALDLYLDGTAEQHGAAELPYGDQGASALLLTRQGPRFVTTPVAPASANSEEADIDVLLDARGNGELRARVSVRGAAAARLRTELEASQTRRERFEASLVRAVPGARLGELDVSPLADLTRPLTYRYTAFVPDAARVSGDAIEVPVDTESDLLARFGRLQRRKNDLVLGAPSISVRRVEIALPEGFELVRLPPGIEIKSSFGVYSLLATARAGKIRVERRLELDVDRVPASRYGELLDFCRAVDEAQAARAVLGRAK